MGTRRFSYTPRYHQPHYQSHNYPTSQSSSHRRQRRHALAPHHYGYPYYFPYPYYPQYYNPYYYPDYPDYMDYLDYPANPFGHDYLPGLNLNPFNQYSRANYLQSMAESVQKHTPHATGF